MIRDIWNYIFHHNDINFLILVEINKKQDKIIELIKNL
jgi:hypothetical protein